MSLPRSLAACLMILTIAPALCAQEGFEPLVEKLPSDANAIALFRVDEILSSPIGQRMKWREKNREQFASGSAIVPPSASHFMLAAKVDVMSGKPAWELAVMRSKTNLDAAAIAKHFGVQVDEMLGLATIALPRNALLAVFSPQVAGAISPADRQFLVRWIRDAQAGRTSPPSYLKEAVQFSDVGGTEIIMALDLEYVVNEGMARAAVEQSDLVKENERREAIIQLLPALRGASLGVTVRDKLYGKIKVDFSQDAAALEGIAKDVILLAIANHGLMVDDFQDWKGAVSGKSVTLEGELSPEGLRQVTSLLQSPASEFEHTEAATASQSPDQSPGDQDVTPAKASKAYYDNVLVYLKDFNKRSRDSKTMGSYASWFEKYARKIESLPILNVDPDLVEFGARTADNMRNASQTLRGTGIASSAAEKQIYNAAPDVYYQNTYFGTNYYYDYSSASRQISSQRRAVRAQYKAQGYGQVTSIRQSIEQDAAETRRKMTERYQIEF